MHVTSKSGRVFRVPSEEEEAAIHAGIAADLDAGELSDEQLKRLRPIGRPQAATRKQPVSIRLSPEVVAHFKAGGAGWQTRLDDVLKAWVRSHPIEPSQR